MTRTPILPLLAALLMLTLAGCNLPGSAPVIVYLTATPAETATLPPPSPTASETPTETPAPIPTASETPTPAQTATPQIVTGEVGRESNCRTGPAGNYELVATFGAGKTVEIVARDLGGGYVVVRDPLAPEAECYMLANSLKTSGELTALPQYTPLPSPTAAPGYTITFKKFDVCKGAPFAVFIIENTGSVPFRSAYVRIQDLKTSKTEEHVLNAFDQYTGGVIAKNIAPLNGGQSGFLTSPLFKSWDPRGKKLRAVFSVCTEKNLQGTCVNQIVEIKP